MLVSALRFHPTFLAEMIFPVLAHRPNALLLRPLFLSYSEMLCYIIYT